MTPEFSAEMFRKPSHNSIKNMESTKISAAIIGMGAMGKGLLYQIGITDAIHCAAVCDSRIDQCVSALKAFKVPHEIADSPRDMEAIIARGITAVCENGEWIGSCKGIDAVVEATSAIGPAARHVLAAIEHQKHVILMNSEIDLMFSPFFCALAAKNGVICTSCDGDQYGVIKHLIDEIGLWGFDLVMAGNIKGYLDRYANPTSIVPEADKRNLDYRMCTSYTDGTKLNIEMAIIANACGLETRTVGMYGPRADHVHDVFQKYDFDALWASRRPFVDYLLGAEPGGGVFVVGYCDNVYQRDMLRYYKMGEGPYYLFYRPYHLCHIEAMQTIIMACREQDCFLGPRYGMRTNVYAYAKKDMRPGDRLDGIGGYACYGKIENTEHRLIQPGLPVALADNVILNRAVLKDERIAIGDVSFDVQRLDYKLYEEALKSA